MSHGTGVQVDDEVISQFNDFKLKREPHNFRYFIYKIAATNEIVIESTGPQSATYEDFAEKLLITDDCRYGVVRFDATTKDGRPTSKILFLFWYPDCARIKNKMIYTSSRDMLRRALVGLEISHSATEESELSREAIEEIVLKL